MVAASNPMPPSTHHPDSRAVPSSDPERAPASNGARDWVALGVLTLAVTLLAIDSTVLSLAIPSLSADLAPSATELLWIGDIYSFVIAGLLVTMGNVADRVGRRRLLLGGAIGFGAASALAAFASSAGALIAARALLGATGATIMPSTLSLIRNIFTDPRRRATAIAIWSAGTTGGMALGPLVGGALLERFWWGSVFLINLPIMILVVILGAWLLPESRHAGGGPIDLPSAALSVAAIMPIVYAVKSFAHDGPSTAALVALVIGASAGTAFVRRQMVIAIPLIDVRLFQRPSFTWAVLSTVLAIFSLSGLMYFFSQYLQLVRGYSTLTAGIAEMPGTGAAIVVVPIVGWLVGRLGQGRTLGGGLIASAAGMVGIAVAESLPGYLPLGIALGLVGVGIGVASAVSTGAVLGAVPAERAGAASALSETGLELGAALGIAVLGTLQDIGYRARLTDALVGAAGLPGAITAVAKQSLANLTSIADASSPAQAQLLDSARHAFTGAMQTTAVVAAAVLVIAGLMAARYVPSERGESHEGVQTAAGH